jgi:hypothetical protein
MNNKEDCFKFEDQLIIGKYYQLTFHKAQYIGKSDDQQNFLFEWKNPLGKKIVLKRTYDMVNGENTKIPLYDYGNETDGEYSDDPYD